MKPEIYVVRIYRRSRDQPRRVLGVVEAPGAERHAHFASLADLAAILGAPRVHLQRSVLTGADPCKVEEEAPERHVEWPRRNW